MRRFRLIRKEDVSGVSGTGRVAEGIAFTDGTCVLRWCSELNPRSTVVHESVHAVEHIHGHGGATVIEWID